MMEKINKTEINNYRISFLSAYEKRACELRHVTLDEAISFAIILFQKYAKLFGDICLIYKEIDDLYYDIVVRTIVLTNDNTMEIKP